MVVAQDLLLVRDRGEGAITVVLGSEVGEEHEQEQEDYTDPE